MSDILLSYEVIITLFVTIILFITLSIAFFNTLYILHHYEKDATSELQYKLEKKSYLVTTIIYISFIIKVILLPYFTFTIDELSNIITGAMCGAGVIGANSYGEPLMVLKIFIIIMMMLWLTLNRYDLESKNFQYFKQKMLFFIFIFVLLGVEIVLEYLFFTNLTTQDPVSCCSTLYSSSQDINPLPFNISIPTLIGSFYLVYISILLVSYFQKKYLLFIASLIYTYLAYLSIVYFFSTYIYELPSHKCPYCLLQSEYYFIGYIIYSSIIIALFYTLNTLLFNKKLFKKNMVWYSVATFFISLNFILYLVINRTFL